MPYKKGRSLVAAVLMVSLLGGGPVFLPLPGVAAAGNAVVDKKAMKQADWQLAEAYGRPMLDVPAGADTIMGPATIPARQMVHFIRQRNPHPKLNAPLEEVVQAYYDEAGREGIRPDVALCQALKETGYFAYGGDVSPDQNNFCGLGATGNKVAGARFAWPKNIPNSMVRSIPGRASMAAGPCRGSITARKSSGCGPKPRRRTVRMTA